MQSAIWVTAAYWSVFKPRSRKRGQEQEEWYVLFRTFFSVHIPFLASLYSFFQGTFVFLMLVHPDWILGRSPLVRMLAWRPTPDYVVFFSVFWPMVLSAI